MTLLRGVPATISLPRTEKWAEEVRAEAIQGGTGRSIKAVSGKALFVSGALGVLSTVLGRAFVNAVWAADWASYVTSDDRVDYLRLAFVVNLFPSGFTLYYELNSIGRVVPVGYSGLYPITLENYHQLVDSSSDISHRGQVVPMKEAGPHRPLYIFNYSMVERLHHTKATKTMLEDIEETLSATPHCGRCAITVSDDGVRVAERYGMSKQSTIRVGSTDEHVLAVLF